MKTDNAIPREIRLTQLENGRLQIYAHAKLNLGLRVSPVLPDGFHNVETWMLQTSWYDTLWVEPCDHLEFSVTGRTENIPTDHQKNLVTRAALALASAAGIPPRAKITLHKILPPGGGIGGGSSDAANVLLALNQLWSLHWEPTRLEAIASQLGSDIPFFIQGTPSLCTGRGNIMSPLHPQHPLYAVLLLPPIGCPTKDVYQTFDRGLQHPPSPPTDWPALARATADQLNRLLINDLEPAAFSVAPALSSLRQRAAAILKAPIHLTGSGSTLFTLCPSAPKAAEFARQLNTQMPPDCPALPVQINPH